jgi:hypothetical protein
MPLNKHRASAIGIGLIIAVAAQVCPFGNPMWGQVATEPFSMTISGPPSSLSPGSPCELKIVIHNVSDREIVLRVTNEDYLAQIDFVTSVKNAATGAPVAELDRRVDGTLILPLMSSFQKKRFIPGETKTVEFNLSRLFDLSKPGTYRVQVSRQVPPEYGTGTVVSNTISVVVKQ